MKVGFIHDHKFIYKNGDYYTTGGLNKEVWSTYLLNNNTLFVYARLVENGDLSATLSSREKVVFELSTTYSHPKDFFFKRRSIYNEIRRFLKNKDCVIIRVPSFLGLIAIEVCKANKIPYAVEVVGNIYDALSNYGSVAASIFAKYIHKKNQKAIFDAPYAIYVTREFLQNSYPCKGITASASDVKLSIDYNFNIQNRITKINNLNNDIVFGQIGHVDVLYKGYEIAFKALKRIKEIYPDKNILYKIAGSGIGDDLKFLASKYGLENNLILLGKLSHQDILVFLDDIDIYIHPSYQEGLSRAIIEALSRGCPCVTSNVGGTGELIIEEFMHPKGDSNKLIKDIKSLLESKLLMKEVSLRNFNHYKHYTEEVLKKKRDDFWNDFFKSVNK